MDRDASNNITIITNALRRGGTGANRVAWWVCIGAVVVGAAAATYFAWLGLTLSHYDARGHLVVARRITDSLTPGWRQIGAVWLPLPHLANALPAWFDWNYRTGFSGVVISISALATGLGALAAYLYTRTGSLAAALAAPALILLNPNVLYLQSTPMTEPLLFGLSLLSVATVGTWLTAPSPTTLRMAGWTLAALTLTRYEGWCIAGVVVASSAAVNARKGWESSLALAPYLGGAIAAFLLLGWASTGHWFVTSGFFVADNAAAGQPLSVLASLWSGTVELGGRTLTIAAVAGIVACVAGIRQQPAAGLALTLLAAGVLPFVAFYQGHPFRIRYMVPLVVACGVLAGMAVARLPRRIRGWGAVALVATVCLERRPLDPHASMVVEAQWETPFRLGRETVSRYLDAEHDGRPILASMGSLGHYMQEASQHGVRLATFVHEGNGDLWAESVKAPRRHVAWMLIEERAEGGDVLASHARSDAAFLAGFVRVAEGGGLALYRRSRTSRETSR